MQDQPIDRRQVLVLGGPKIAIVVAALLIVIFGCLAVAVVAGQTTRFDEAVLLTLRTPGNPANPIGPPWVQEMARDITSLGSLSILVFVALISSGYLLLTARRDLALQIAVALVGGEALSVALKSLFDRPRPQISQLARVFTASFPSGHAMLSAVTFLTLGLMFFQSAADSRLKRYGMAIAIFMTVMVGLSRLYLGVHYPSDVLAGWALGTAWALLCRAAFQWLARHR